MDRGELYSGLGFILVGLIIFGIGYAFSSFDTQDTVLIITLLTGGGLALRGVLIIMQEVLSEFIGDEPARKIVVFIAFTIILVPTAYIMFPSLFRINT